MKTNLIVLLCALVIGSSGTSYAQLAPPNESGMTMGHLHLFAKNADALNKFFITLGGKPASIRPDLVLFPGAAIVVRESQSANGGTEGSAVNHVAFTVKNFKASKSTWDAAGLQWEKDVQSNRGFLISPEGIRVEIIENKRLATDIAFDHIHFFIQANPKDASTWYAQTFGARQSADKTGAELPGVRLTFLKSNTPVVATKGRVLDHIGFDVKNLEDYIKTLAARGIKFDMAYQKLPKPVTTTAFAFVTDPWGTSIELTQDLEGKK